MDQVLGKLYNCHCSSNSAVQQRGQRHRGKVAVGAAAAPSPLTHSQRALLHTAIQRSRRPKQQVVVVEDNTDQQQQQQHMPQQELQLRSDLLDLQQLVEHAISDTNQDSKHLQQQLLQPVAASIQAHPSSVAATTDVASKVATDQSTPVQSRSTASLSDMHQQQRQQQQMLQQQLHLRQLFQQQQIRQRRLQLQIRSEPAALTALIKRCRTWQTLQHLFHTYTDHFNPLHVSAAITHLAQLHGPIKADELQQQPQGLQQLMRDLTAAAASCIPDYGPRQLANTIWAISKLGCGGKMSLRLRAQYLIAFTSQLPAAAPQHISNVALAVGSMGWGTSTEWKRDLLAAAKSKQESFKPQELANLLYALPLLGAQPSRQWLSEYLETCHDSLSRFNSQELSLLGTGLVRLKWQPGEHFLLGYMQAVQQHFVATYSSKTSSENSKAADNSSVTAPDIKQQHQQHQQPYDGHSNPQQRPAGFQAQGLVNVLWVLAVWGAAPDSAWQASCIAAAKRLLGECTMQGLSTLFWAMTRLKFTSHGQLLGRLVKHSQPLLPSATSTDLALILWSLGTMACISRRESNGASWFAQGHDDNCVIEAAWLQDLLYYSSRTLAGASANDLVCLLLGVTRMRLQPGARWLHAVTVQAHHLVHDMSSTELSALLLCLARLKHKPASSFAASYCSRSSKLLQKTASAVRRRSRRGACTLVAANSEVYSPQLLANTLGAMAMLDHRPSEGWSSSFFAASRLLLPAFAGKDFAYCMWGLATLEMQPSQRWMDELLVQLRRHIPTMCSSELSAIIWALAKLGHKPGVSWMQRFLDRVTALQHCLGSSSQDSNQKSRRRPSSSAYEGSTASGTVQRALQEAAAGPLNQPHDESVVPKTPLQLSADFSSIILHGLTIWATARLDYPSVLRASDSREDWEQSVDICDLQDSISSARQVQVSSVYGTGGSGAVNMTVSRDGSVLYQF